MEDKNVLVIAVKAGEEWVLNILGVPFGGPFKGKDKAGDYFDDKTNIHQDKYPEVPLVFAHGFDPETMEPSKEIQFIGKAKWDHVDERGHWYTAVLDKASEVAKKIWDAALKGLVGASSGTASHLMRRDKDGHLLEWPVVEMTVVDNTGAMRPVNPYAVAIPSLKAMCEQAGLKLDITEPEAGEAAQSTATAVQAEGNTNVEETKVNPTAIEKPEVKAGPDAGEQLLEKIQNEMKAANELKAKEAEKQAALESQIKAFVAEAVKGAPAVKGGAPAYLSKTGRGDDENKAFWYWMRTGDKGAYKADITLNEGDDEQGGAIVPADFHAQIIQHRGEASIIRRAGVTPIQCSASTVNVPIEKAGAEETAPAATNESAGATPVSYSMNDAEPLDTKAITLVKYTRLHRISEELLADQKANLLEFLSARVGRAFALLENSLCFTAATATSAVYGSTKGKDAAAAATLAVGDVTGLYYSLDDFYRDGAVWVMAKATEAAVRGLAGNPWYFNPQPHGVGQVGSAGQIMGNPAYNAAAMSAIGASNKSIFFGNLQAGFTVAENGGYSVKRLNERYADTGEVGFLFSMRFGTGVTNAAALMHLLHPTG